MNPQPVFFIAKKEFMDNFRNKWVIVLTIAFALLAIVFSLFGSIFGSGWQDIGATVGVLTSVVTLIIPIIAIILGYSAIIGEIERGSMNALLSLPTTRFEIVLGKLFGLGSILASAIFIGFGIAGIIIGLNIENPDVAGYIIFIVATILYSWVFLCLALFFSTLFKKRSTAMGGAIFLWILFIMIIPTVIQGLLFAEVGFEAVLSGEGAQIPDWYFAGRLVDPGSVYTSLLTLSIADAVDPGNFFQTPYPSYYSAALMTVLLIAWISIFFTLSYWRFSKKDI